jgi:hypothetical protein
LHLGGIHGDVGGGDDVPQVRDGAGVELALGPLDEEAVLMKNVEDGAHMVKVVGPRGAVDEDVVEEDEDEPP